MEFMATYTPISRGNSAELQHKLGEGQLYTYIYIAGAAPHSSQKKNKRRRTRSVAKELADRSERGGPRAPSRLYRIAAVSPQAGNQAAYSATTVRTLESRWRVLPIASTPVMSAAPLPTSSPLFSHKNGASCGVGLAGSRRCSRDARS